MSREASPVLPDYQGACTSNLVPELIKQAMGGAPAQWLPPAVIGSRQIVLLVLDGLGWDQLEAKSPLAPTLMSFDGGPITTIAPTTTAVGLTSLVTGQPPAKHGVLGYRLSVGDRGVLNVLKWTTDDGDMRELIPAGEFQRQAAFAGNDAPAVVRNEFLGSGFTQAHLQDVRLIGYSVSSSLPVEVWRLANAGEPFIYAYYRGIDTVAHATGLGEHYDAELYTVDRLVRDLLGGLPEGCTLVVTSDHGQVEVGGRTLTIDQDIVDRCWRFSGEGRFRWLHAHNGAVDELKAVCDDRYGELAWVLTRREMIDAGWFGGPVSDFYADRLGDVAIVASAPVAFKDPVHAGEHHMQSRHGSMTSAEVRVPLLAKRVIGR